MAVINPSDTYMMAGYYNGTYKYPLTPGSEGCGTVVAYGGGWAAWWLMGKRVAFVRCPEGAGKFSIGGSYAEYAITNVSVCVSLDDSITTQQAACGILNPLSAVGLLDRCLHHKAKAVIQTGAASQLGRMMIKLLAQNGIEVINIVRKEEQVQMLKNEYRAHYVLNSEDKCFEQDLWNLTNDLGATVALEAVAGELTGKVLQVLPRGGILIQYGALSEQRVSGINPITLIFKAQKIEPFLLTYWIKDLSYYGQWSAFSASKALI